MIKSIVIALVVPCYNEEDVLPRTVEKLLAQLRRMVDCQIVDENSYICFIDDGSEDNTWKLIDDFTERTKNIRGIKLSRNFGHQNALLAGLISVMDTVDCAISIDGDLQQDERAITDFLREYVENGADIVFGVRRNRLVDSFLKRTSACGFYQLMRLMGVDILEDHADYRLMSKRAIKALSGYQEQNLFLRGLVHDIGFKKAVVNFDVQERQMGESKYTLWKMLSFALNGITSFSVTPLRFVTVIGILCTLLSALMAMYVLIMGIYSNEAIPGWASIVLPIYFLGGVQVLSIGIIGEYVGRVYMESKGRPRYIVEVNKVG